MDGPATLLALKTQLNLAIGQREEDPERAWLERRSSVRDRLGAVAEAAAGDGLSCSRTSTAFARASTSPCPSAS